MVQSLETCRLASEDEQLFAGLTVREHLLFQSGFRMGRMSKAPPSILFDASTSPVSGGKNAGGGVRSCSLLLTRIYNGSMTPVILGNDQTFFKGHGLSCSVAPVFPFFWWLPHKKMSSPKRVPFFSRVTEQLSRDSRYAKNRDAGAWGVTLGNLGAVRVLVWSITRCPS